MVTNNSKMYLHDYLKFLVCSNLIIFAVRTHNGLKSYSFYETLCE